MLDIDKFGQFLIKTTVFLPSKCFLRMNIRGNDRGYIGLVKNIFFLIATVKKINR